MEDESETDEKKDADAPKGKHNEGSKDKKAINPADSAKTSETDSS